MLLGDATRDAIEKEANRALAGSLREDALRKVREGLTTLEEVARVLGVEPAYGDEVEDGS